MSVATEEPEIDKMISNLELEPPIPEAEDQSIMDLTMNPSALDPEIQDTVDENDGDDGDDGDANDSNVNDGDADSEDENDDDDDDDDDIKITIGEIKASTPPYSTGANYTPLSFNLAKRSGVAFGPGGQVTSNSGAKSKNIGLNLDTVGTYNGASIYEFNLDTIEEKPWRKPGADITDYFNYGFNEVTWKIYCEKQKKIQQVLAGGGSSDSEPVSTGINQPATVTPQTKGPKGPSTGPPQVNSESPIPVASVNENSKYSGLGLTKKAGPPPGRKSSGTIDVIGGGTPSTPSMIASRRPPDTPETFESPATSFGPIISPFLYPPPPFGIPPPHAGLNFLPPHPTGPLANCPPVDDYKIMSRKPEDDREERDKREREERDKREREERDKREREERERRDKRRERDDRDKRDRRSQQVGKEKPDRDRRSSREKSERPKRDESRKRKSREKEKTDRERDKRSRRER